MNIIAANDEPIEIPLRDPQVAAHFRAENTMAERLLEQINTERIYQFAFKHAKDWVMLDIGANVGLVSLYAAPVCKRIVALEPTNQIDILRKVCSGYPHIESLKLALAAHNGSADFFVNDINTTAGSMSQTYGQPVPVSTITLSKLIVTQNLTKVHFCKVDIEGSELECLTPLEVQRCHPHIGAYFVEVHNCPNSTWEHKVGRLAEVFMRAGYSRLRILGDSIFACIQ